MASQENALPLYAPDPGRAEKAREYARLRRRLFVTELAVGALYLLLLLFSGFSVALRESLVGPPAMRVGLYVAAVLGSYGLALTPLHFYGGYLLPRHYGLSVQSWRGWLWDRVKGGLLGLFLGVLFLEALYALLRAFPGTWWLFGAGVALLFSVVLSHLAPVLLIPLFFRSTPLADQELSRRLSRLAAAAGARVRGVYTLDLSRKTTTANAALVGLGRTRSIVLGDTLLQAYTPEEIGVIVAHELGHHVHRHIPKLMLLQTLVTLVGFFGAHLLLGWWLPALDFSSAADIGAFPLLALIMGGLFLILLPLTNAYSRRVEAAADGFALELTRAPLAFISMMEKLAAQNLAEPEPSPWVELIFYDHPPYQRRIAVARNYRGGAPSLAPH